MLGFHGLEVLSAEVGYYCGCYHQVLPHNEAARNLLPDEVVPKLTCAVVLLSVCIAFLPVMIILCIFLGGVKTSTFSGNAFLWLRGDRLLCQEYLERTRLCKHDLHDVSIYVIAATNRQKTREHSLLCLSLCQGRQWDASHRVNGSINERFLRSTSWKKSSGHELIDVALIPTLYLTIRSPLWTMIIRCFGAAVHSCSSLLLD